jgi:hypothetical protein
VRIVRISRDGDTYVGLTETSVGWTVEISLGPNGTPFREEVVWPAASVVAIGGGTTIHFLAAQSGAIVSSLSLGDDVFGHFGPADGELLCVLGWRDVVAVDKTLAVRWISKHVAVDGIIWKSRHDERIQLSAEMDPPGGWVDVELDAITGRELSRARHPDDRSR